MRLRTPAPSSPSLISHRHGPPTLPPATKSLSGVPLTVAAVGTGILGYFRIYASDGTTCHMQGTMTEIGGGGDLTVDNTNIDAGQNLILGGFTINMQSGHRYVTAT